MQRALPSPFGWRRPRLMLAAAGLVLGLGLAALLPAEAAGTVARLFDLHVVQAFHDLELQRFLCL